MLTARAQFVVVRSLVYDGGVVVSNVGHVRRLVHDGDVAVDRNDRSLDAARSKFIVGDERILVGTDVVIIVRPIVDASTAIEVRLRWKRRPTHILIARSPRNPSRRPFFPGNPNPTDIAKARPPAVMISRPTKRLIRDPRPTGVCVDPATVGVRPPRA